MQPSSFDLETYIGTRSVFAPKIVCGAWSEGVGVRIGLREEAIQRFLAMCADPECLIVNTFLPFDVGCVLEAVKHDRAATRLVWDKLKSSGMVGIDICQQLLDVASDRLDHREHFGYSQTNIARWNGLEAEDKGVNPWRMYYSQLDGVAPELWPVGAREYVVGDATTPLAVYQKQLEENQTWVERAGYPVLHEAGAQTWSQVCLHLIAAHGMRVSPVRVRALRAQVDAHIAELAAPLHTAGLLRLEKGQYKRTIKNARARMTSVMSAQGKQPALTAKGGIALDEDACILSGDPLLVQYADYVSSSTLRSRVEDLEQGCDGLPIHTEFTSIRGTGRTSSRKPREPHAGTQQQNQPRAVGAREAYEPREGYCYLYGDVEAAEMHPLAQNTKIIAGYSKLGDLLNAGIDPHAYFAGVARLGGMSVAEVLARPDAKDMRSWAKPCNFGFPGGMGAEKFILFSRKQYGVLFTRDEAKHYKALWLQTFPEMAELGRYVEYLLGGRETCTVRLPIGGFVAGGKRYTAARNFFFQGPTAAGVKAGMNHTMYECYADWDSPLYGSRVCNEIHDELVLECPIGRQHEAGERLASIMKREFDPYCPDYPVQIDVIAATVWSKKAKRVVKNGRLEIWSPEV